MQIEQVGRTPRILVTGATGFVGSNLLTVIVRRGWYCRVLVRRRSSAIPDSVEQIVAGDLSLGSAVIAGACDDVDYVIHLAGRAHRKGESKRTAVAMYMRDNVEVTRNLATICAAKGVRRLLYVSSTKVYGDASREQAIDEHTPPDPTDAYGETKLLAENAANDALERSDTDLLIFRPPLIYGPGVKANFLNLMRLVHRGVPLPFKGVKNLRSLLYAGNLADALVHSLRADVPSGQAFLVSDGPALSTAGIVEALARALDVDARLFYVPRPMMNAARHMPRAGAAVDRLLGSLHLDISGSRAALGWSPPVPQDQAFHTTAQWFLQQPQ